MASEPPGPEEDACRSSSCGSCCRRRRRREPRSLKRKLEDDMEEQAAPRAEPEDEVAAMLEAVGGQREMVAQLCAELEEERAASASAASEAMSMILRLQREKGAAQMEARQFRRFAEEKMEHDRQELLAFEQLLDEREQVIQALSCQVRAYRECLLTHGVSLLDSLEAAWDAPAVEEGGHDGEGPASHLPPATGHMENLLVELSPSLGTVGDAMEKGVVVTATGTQSPEALPSGEPALLGCNGEHREHQEEEEEEFQSSGGGGGGDDDNTSDRVYTVDAVHSTGEAVGGIEQGSAGATKEPLCRVDDGHCEEEDVVDVRKLEIRLRALEADKEAMREAIVSVRSDKAQLVFLKEIAQLVFCSRDASTVPISAPPPERKLVIKPFLVWCFSFMSMIIKATILKSSLLWHSSLMSTVKSRARTSRASRRARRPPSGLHPLRARLVRASRPARQGFQVRGRRAEGKAELCRAVRCGWPEGGGRCGAVHGWRTVRSAMSGAASFC